MFSRLLVAAACALGFSGALGASSALAEDQRWFPPPWEVKAAAVQVWTEKGYHHTIACPTLTSDPACDSRRWPDNVFEVLDEYGGYRVLTRTGNWSESGASAETVYAMEEADERGLPGAAKVEWSYYAFDRLVGRQDPVVAERAGQRIPNHRVATGPGIG